MKKIINGKVYDSSTAQQVAAWYSRLSKTDFAYYEESLYRKRTGEYFLHGEGGPASNYAVSCGNNGWDGGEKIIPLNYDSAREWGERKMDADDYEAEFGPVTEDESTVAMSISLPANLAEKARRTASERGMAVSALIAELIAELEQREKRGMAVSALIASNPDVADVEVYSFCGTLSKHTDHITALDDVPEDSMAYDYDIMGEEEYNSTILANSCTSAEFADWYGDADAKVLVIWVKA